jgi:hypothetical protein
MLRFVFGGGALCPGVHRVGASEMRECGFGV